MNLYSIPSSYTVDLDTARVVVKPAWSTERREMFGKPADRVMVQLVAEAVEPNGRRWDCLLGVYTGTPRVERMLSVKLEADLWTLREKSLAAV